MSSENLKITKIILHKKKSSCSIFLKNELFREISLDLVLKYKLKKGMTLDKETINKISGEQRIYDLKQTVYNYAAYKPRTEKQVERKLVVKGFNKEELATGLEFLKHFNLIDDKRYAATFSKEYLNRKKCGKKKMYQELLKRGINKDLAHATVEDLFKDTDYLELAINSSQKKLKTLKSKPLEKQKQTLIAYLQRQGFEWDVIKKVLAESLNK